MYKNAFSRPGKISIEVEGKRRVAARKKISGTKTCVQINEASRKSYLYYLMCTFYDRHTQSRCVSRVGHEKRLRKREMIHYTGIPRLRYLVNAPALPMHTNYFVNVSKSMEMRLEGACTPASSIEIVLSLCGEFSGDICMYRGQKDSFFRVVHAKKHLKSV